MNTIAFTGPQTLSEKERGVVIATLDTLMLEHNQRDTYIVTGGCIGLDACVAFYMHLRGYHVHTVLPALSAKTDPDWEAYCSSHEKCPPGVTNSDTYRIRNQRMVGISDRLVAFLKHGELGRNGETMTFNIARHANKPARIVTL